MGRFVPPTNAAVGAMASRTDLRARLDISSTVEDYVLLETLIGVSAAIEALAGRPLMRRGRICEYFRGGREVLWLTHSPVVVLHSVRESDSNDFATEGEYTELVEGTDFVHDYGQLPIGAPRQSGALRSLNGVFGARTSESLIQVCYDAGYRTPTEEEANAETLELDFESSPLLKLAVARSTYDYAGEISESRISVPADTVEELSFGVTDIGTDAESRLIWSNDTIYLYALLQNLYWSHWRIANATVKVGLKDTDEAGATLTVRAQTPTGFLGLPAIKSADIEVLAPTTSYQELTADTDNADSPAGALAALNDQMAYGLVCFGLVVSGHTPISGSDYARYVAKTLTYTTEADRPEVTLTPEPLGPDLYTMPDDLRHACLLQAAHDWQIRKAPGFRQETQRGLNISSGISYMRDPATMLPEVRSIAMRYAQLM